MAAQIYSQRLGPISDEQLKAALDHFNLGRFVRAEPIPFGLFGQNVFVSSTQGEFVLRGDPHFWWQFPTEQFYTRLLHECTPVPVPWPYLIDSSTGIFGWSYVLMPRMPGLQLADPQVRAQLEPEARKAIARDPLFLADSRWLKHSSDSLWLPLAVREGASLVVWESR